MVGMSRTARRNESTSACRFAADTFARGFINTTWDTMLDRFLAASVVVLGTLSGFLGLGPSALVRRWSLVLGGPRAGVTVRFRARRVSSTRTASGLVTPRPRLSLRF